jgi:DNA repair exonuclease SbcCD nuclease subunit
MKDHYRIVIIADTHIGAERRPWLRKMGVTPDKYDKPAQEAMLWASENNVDMTILAGDMYDRRTPTPSDYIRGHQLEPDLVVAGNHDITAFGRKDALWSHDAVIRERGEGYAADGLHVVGLPWPRPTDWPLNLPCTIESEISQTREYVLEALEARCDEIPVTEPAVLVGHAMVSYGNTTPDDPGLMLGKDVVLPYESLTSLPNIGGVYLGHVHDPSSPAYVGSTQPTDWGEADQVKSFTVVDITRCAIGPALMPWWTYETRQIPYTTSLKLATVSDEDYDLTFYGDYDGVRLTWMMREGDDPEQLAIAERALRAQHPYVEVIVEHEVKRAARVETDKPLATLSPLEQVSVWLTQRDTPQDDALQVIDRSSIIVSHSKE